MITGSDLRTLADVDIDGRTVLLRADLNVPLGSDGEITDDFRIASTVPTVDALLERGASVVIASHLGRPSGPDPAWSLGGVAARLAELAGHEVVLAGDVAGPSARDLARDAPVVMLENVRFEPGETSNDPALAHAFAELADVFVMDAFGAAHRSHASTVGVAEALPSVAGPLLLAEVEAFARILEAPPRPFVVVLGGAKVSTKLGVIQRLVGEVDTLLVGGAMSLTMLAAAGVDVGESKVEEAMLEAARQVIASGGDRIVLPTDYLVGAAFDPATSYETRSVEGLAAGGLGLDIGPATAASFSEYLAGAGSVFWNGPMGVAEWEPFAQGTRLVAEAVAGSDAYSVAGGGDTVAALRDLGLEGGVTHLSTGGGAGLELIEHGTLPGLDVLRSS